MKKEEIKLITLKVFSNGQDALDICLDQSGTVIRRGVGGLPEIGVSAKSQFDSLELFNKVLLSIPDALLQESFEYIEETPNGSLEYEVGLFGGLNNNTREDPVWSKSMVTRVKLDQQSNFQHQIMALLDGLMMDAVDITNSWYFDVMMEVQYQAKSSELPENTMIATSHGQDLITEQYSNYVNQMLNSARQWDMRKFVDGKTYLIQGIKTHGKVKIEEGSFDVRFMPVDAPKAKTPKKKWWLF